MLTMKIALVGVVSLGAAVGFSGCGASEKSVAYSVTCPGVRAGTISYVDENGKGAVEVNVLIPWTKSFKARDGQKLSLTLQPVPLQSNVPGVAAPDTNVRYVVEIRVGATSHDMQAVCRNEVQGVGGLASCSAVVGESK